MGKPRVASPGFLHDEITTITVLGGRHKLPCFAAVKKCFRTMFAPGRSCLVAFLVFAFVQVFAQQPDSAVVIDLKELQVMGRWGQDVGRLPEVQGTILGVGRRSEVVKVTALDADLSTNNARQLFAKVPGITIWESDGSGLQMGIATRGLSPNRSWEFNVRQNGYDISSEVFGYPEAYYTPPMEAVERIELIRGAASLQFGPQFGGLLNYVLKSAPTNKPMVFETRQTVGSYGLFNSYNSLGGTKGRFSYFAYLHHRNANGWRANSRYSVNSGHVALGYAASARTRIALEYTRMMYASQQPGGLTDSLFALDARRSLRSRNWFSTPWNLAALTMEHGFNANTRLSVKVFANLSERNSVGFMRPVTVADGYVEELASFSARQVDRDRYTNFGTEVRVLHGYTLLGQRSNLAAGLRSYSGSTLRRQQGVGTTGDDLDLTVSSDFAREFTLSTVNHAAFLENQFKLGQRFSLVPGIRYEIINSAVEGRINASGTGDIGRREQDRQILLYGLGSEFSLCASSSLYANYSRSYRPVLYSDLIPSATTDQVDPDLQDASGSNLDLGYRGTVKNWLQFDIGVYQLLYDNRIGTILRDGVAFRTNIGTSLSRGVEGFVEWSPLRMMSKRSRACDVRIFTSVAWNDARYTRWDDPARVNDPERTLVDRRVEYAPELIARAGATWKYRSFSITFQANSTSEVYTDALNTVEANAAATVGRLPGYEVMDLGAAFVTKGGIELRGGVNNLADAQYATRRAGGYPGPGLLPANGRTAWLSIGARF
jgi:Fe(3+) dicitrate transport protein